MDSWWNEDTPVSAPVTSLPGPVENPGKEDRWWEDDISVVGALNSHEEVADIGKLKQLTKGIGASANWQQYAKEDLADSYFPQVTAVEAGLGASIGAPISRALGFSDNADSLNRAATAYNTEIAKTDEGGIVPAIVKRGFRGAAQTIPSAVIAGAVAGPYGALGVAGLQEADRAITEGKDVGLSGTETAIYAAEQGAVEALIGSAMQKLGLGGVEDYFGGKVVSNGLKEAFKNAAVRTVLQEIPEEIATEIGHNVISKLNDVDPNAMSAESLKQTVADTVVQTIITGGLVSSPDIARGAINTATGNVSEAEAKFAENPSRKNYQEAFGETPPPLPDRQAKAEEVRARQNTPPLPEHPRWSNELPPPPSMTPSGSMDSTVDLSQPTPEQLADTQDFTQPVEQIANEPPAAPVVGQADQAVTEQAPPAEESSQVDATEKPLSIRGEKARDWLLKDALRRRPMEAKTPQDFVNWIRKGFGDENRKDSMYATYLKESGKTLEQVAEEAFAAEGIGTPNDPTGLGGFGAGMGTAISDNLYDSWRTSLLQNGEMPSTERNSIPWQFWNILKKEGYQNDQSTVERFIELGKSGAFNDTKSAQAAMEQFRQQGSTNTAPTALPDVSALAAKFGVTEQPAEPTKNAAVVLKEAQRALRSFEYKNKQYSKESLALNPEWVQLNQAVKNAQTQATKAENAPENVAARKQARRDFRAGKVNKGVAKITEVSKLPPMLAESIRAEAATLLKEDNPADGTAKALQAIIDGKDAEASSEVENQRERIFRILTGELDQRTIPARERGEEQRPPDPIVSVFTEENADRRTAILTEAMEIARNPEYTEANEFTEGGDMYYPPNSLADFVHRQVIAEYEQNGVPPLLITERDITNRIIELAKQSKTSLPEQLQEIEIESPENETPTATGLTGTEQPEAVQRQPQEAVAANSLFNADNLESLFKLTREQAEATVAIADAMGLDKSKIELARGKAGSGAVTLKRMMEGHRIKGSVQFVDAGKALIRALEGPDVATGVHELAHVARRFLFNQNVPQANREGITDADIRAAQRWSGATNGKWTEAAEEKFARGFERYLHDREAPTQKLQSLFSKFADWLGKIYSKLAGSPLDLKISTEMRGVFDALVSRGEVLAAAKPVAPNQTGERSLGERVAEVAHAKAEKKTRAKKGEKTTEALEALAAKAAKGEATVQYDDNGVEIESLNQLDNAEFADAAAFEPLIDRLVAEKKTSFKEFVLEVEALYGDSRFYEMAPALAQIWDDARQDYKRRGVSAAKQLEAMRQVGLENVRKALAGKPLNKTATRRVIRQNTTVSPGEAVKMTPRDLMKLALSREARGAARGYRAAKADVKWNQEQVIEFVNQQIPKKLQSRVLNVIKNANSPALMGKAIQAINKLSQRLEAQAARSELRKAIRDAKKKVGRGEYKEKLKAILAGLKMTSPKPETLAKMQSLLEAARTEMASNIDQFTQIPAAMIQKAEEVLANQSATPLNQLTGEDIRAIQDAIESIVALDNFKNKLLFGGKVRNAEEAVTEATDGADGLVPRHGKKPNSTDPRYRKFENAIRYGLVELGVSPETLVRYLGGMSRKIFSDNFRAAEKTFAKLSNKTEDGFRAALKTAGISTNELPSWSDVMAPAGLRKAIRSLRGKSKTVTERHAINLPSARSEEGGRVKSLDLTKAEIVEVILHIGDTDTKAKLLGTGKGIRLKSWAAGEPAVKLEADDMQAVLDQADKTDPRIKVLADELSKIVNAQGKETGKVWQRMYGREFELLEKYWPRHADDQDFSDEPNPGMKKFQDSMLEHQSHLKERSGGSQAIVVGDAFGTFVGHTARSNAFISKAEAVHDALRLLGDEKYKRTLSRTVKDGEGIQERLKNYIDEWQGVSLKGKSHVGRVVEATARNLVSNFTKAALGFKPWVWAMQFSGITSFMAEIKPQYVMSSLAGAVNASAVNAEIKKWSDVLRRRLEGTDFNSLTDPDVMSSPAQQMAGIDTRSISDIVALEPIRKVDNYNLRVGWLAAKAEGQAKGLTGDALMEYTAQRTEQLIEDTQASWDVRTTSTVQALGRQNLGWKMFSMFASERLKKYNMAMQAAHEYRFDSNQDDAAKARLAEQIAYGQIANAIITTSARWGFRGTLAAATAAILGYRDDEEEKNVLDFLYDSADSMLGSWAIAGDAVSVMARLSKGWFEGEERGQLYRPRETPLAQFGTMLVESIVETRKAVMEAKDDKRVDRGENKGKRKAPYSASKAAEKSILTIGTFLGLPAQGIDMMIRDLLPHNRMYDYSSPGVLEVSKQAKAFDDAEKKFKEMVKAGKPQAELDAFTQAERVPLYQASQSMDAIKARYKAIGEIRENYPELPEERQAADAQIELWQEEIEQIANQALKTSPGAQ